MTEAVLLLAVFTACYLGFGLLALSQDRHWHQLLHSFGGGRDCPPRLVLPLRVGGYALLLGALALALLRDGPGFGSLVWATMLSAGAIAIVATLTIVTLQGAAK